MNELETEYYIILLLPIIPKITKYENAEIVPRTNVLNKFPKICEAIINPKNNPNNYPFDYTDATSLTYPDCAIYYYQHNYP
jgi:hypothetical protein